MAAQGGAPFLEKVRKLLGRQDGKPVLKPNRTLALRDAVANRKLKKGEATCVTEMSVLMACWKQNNFVDDLCSNEMKAFYSCIEKARASMKSKSDQSSIQGGRLHPKQATVLLKRYPNLRTEV
ncbi:small ribosomal subunit protein mS37 [Trachinotus anak]|uniref:small ribosomal subunit protein mS37 n=1 Tax=Trachinotus anak TaxID=443729 RepID=UPI0039F1D6F9